MWFFHGERLLDRFPQTVNFLSFSRLSKYCLPGKSRVHFCQVSVQLSCYDTCKIWLKVNGYTQYGFKNNNVSDDKMNAHGCIDPYPWYSISQEICTRFCCALLCCGYAIVHNEFTWSIYPYSSGLLCWQCQWSKPDGYGKISECITTTKHSKAKTVCIFLGIYCTYS